MAKTGSGKATSYIKPSGGASRAGRPLAANAGEVETRLLDAATHLFLNFGFEGTSCDQVVALAGAGKGSLYARYANKEALFEAVVRRTVDHTLRPADEIAAELPLVERLRAAGREILQQALTPDALAMMRLVIATANRFPDLAQLADKFGWEGGVERIAGIIAARSQSRDSIAQAKPAAAWFISLTFAPQQMRALLGDSQSLLQASATTRVDEAVNILARSGWLDGWE